LNGPDGWTKTLNQLPAIIVKTILIEIDAVEREIAASALGYDARQMTAVPVLKLVSR
jgi:hypothetical protein